MNRTERLRGRHALVDGIPFRMPVDSRDTPALMAAFPISAARAGALLPGGEVRPLRIGGDLGLLVITVLDYRSTDIGAYVEFSIAIACVHGRLGFGQFVIDLPVQTEVSVRGGKGIWGMPKHLAELDFAIGPERVSSTYALDGRLCCRIEVDRPRWTGLPVRAAAVNYCAHRGMLHKSSVSFRGHGGLHLPLTRSARLTLGDHPRMAAVKRLGVRPRPLFAGYFPETRGILDDHLESWFLTYEDAPA